MKLLNMSGFWWKPLVDIHCWQIPKCFLLKNDCDEKKKTLIDRGESFPGFKCRGWFLENMGNTNL